MPFVKNPESTYSLGPAMIRTDTPTRNRLKELADNKGLTIAAYLRNLVNSIDEQGRLVPDRPSLDATPAGIAGMLKAIDTKLDKWISPHGKRDIWSDIDAVTRPLDKPARWICNQVGLNPDEAVIDTLNNVIDKLRARQSGQLTMEPGASEA